MSNVIIRTTLTQVDDEVALQLKRQIEELVADQPHARVEMSILADRTSFLPRRRQIELTSRTE